MITLIEKIPDGSYKVSEKVKDRPFFTIDEDDNVIEISNKRFSASMFDITPYRLRAIADMVEHAESAGNHTAKIFYFDNGTIGAISTE